MSCALLSGQGGRLWMVVQTDCSKSPFSPAAAFAPVFTGLDTAAASFIGNLESMDLTYGSEVHEVNVAQLLGATGTIKGVSKGSGQFVVIHDDDVPIGSKVLSGNMYDFCATLDFTDPTGSDAAGKVVGRCRVGQFQAPFNLGGEPVRITIPFTTDGKVYGQIIGQSDT